MKFHMIATCLHLHT